MFRVSAIKVNNRICRIKCHTSIFAIKTGLCPLVKNLLVFSRVRIRAVFSQLLNVNKLSFQMRNGFHKHHCCNVAAWATILKTEVLFQMIRRINP